MHFLLAVLFAGLLNIPSVALTPVAHADEPPLSTVDWQAYASTTAKKAGLSPVQLTRVIGCESNWVATSTGDNGTSFGLAQLHYPSRDWGISTSTAFDEKTSIDIMVSAWKRGEQNRWSCYKILGYSTH